MSDAESAAAAQVPPVADVLASTVVLLLNVGFARTGLTGDPDVETDLDEAQRAIEGVRTLMPGLEATLPPAELNQFRGALSELQLAYSRALAPPPPAGEPEPQVEPAERPKIWTPKGDV